MAPVVEMNEGNTEEMKSCVRLLTRLDRTALQAARSTLSVTPATELRTKRTTHDGALARATQMATHPVPTPAIYRPKLVIFDKDGTLICFHRMWIPWAMRTAQKVNQASGQNLDSHIYDLFGLCTVQGKVKPGLLAEGTMDQIRQQMTSLLVSRNMPRTKVVDLVEECLMDSYARAASSLQQITDLQRLFVTLRNNYVKIAICTADNRNSTMAMLKEAGVAHLVDLTMCGDDTGSVPKPDPRNALAICQELNISPEDAVMVGDTKADLIMAQTAGLGGGVGVLSGVGTRDHLKPYASALIDHVGDLIDFFAFQHN